MRGLANRAGVVTGGGSGIGRAIARRLAVEGCHVSIFDRNLDGARAVVDEIRGAGGVADASQVDIRDGDRVDEAVAEVASAHGVPWFLVNAAGWDSARPFLQSDRTLWKQVIDINLYGAAAAGWSTSPRTPRAPVRPMSPSTPPARAA